MQFFNSKNHRYPAFVSSPLPLEKFACTHPTHISVLTYWVFLRWPFHENSSSQHISQGMEPEVYCKTCGVLQSNALECTRRMGHRMFLLKESFVLGSPYNYPSKKSAAESMWNARAIGTKYNMQAGISEINEL